jgi:predicted MPP superfamily phosphohydrolase
MFASIVSSLNKLLFFGLLGILFLLFDLYAWQAVKTILKSASSRTKLYVTWAYWFVSILFIVLIILRPFIQIEKIGSSALTLLQVFGFILVIAKLFIILPLIAEDVFRGVEWVYNKFNKNSLQNTTLAERRKFISITGLMVGAVPLVGMSWGLIKGAHNYKIKRKKIQFDNLPSSFHGLKLVQVSDIHSGSFWDKKAVERGIQMILDLKPDILVFTGDLVNNTADEMDNWKALFSKLDAKMGVYSVLGNHDYGDYVVWSSEESKLENLEKLKNVHAEMGWNLLLNDSVILEKNSDKIALLGVENWSAKGNFPKYGKLNEALETCKEVDFKVLLSHDPSHWRAEVLQKQENIMLTLSGHTHGFQFGIETHGFKWSPVKYMYPEWAGLYSKEDKYLYVNRGFGYIGYPGRLGINPEITEITLLKKDFAIA